MPSLMMQPTRTEVTRSFPVLGFTVRTGFAPAWFEAAIATDPALFEAGARSRRTPANFYSSRSQGPLPAERGEAVYLVPQAVMDRFAGQEHLYYALAVYHQPAFNNPQVISPPKEAAPSVYVSKSFTGASRRLTVRPSRRGGMTGREGSYTEQNPDSLTWGGDEPAPGASEPVAGRPPVAPEARPTTPPASGDNGARRSAAPAGSSGPTAPPVHASALDAEYDDGFGQMSWPPTPTAAATANGDGAAASDDGPGIEGPIPDLADPTAQALAVMTPEYSGASRFEPINAGNFRVSSGQRTISRIVIHITDGSNVNGTVGWFKNPASGVSSHYVVGRDGEIVQMVAENDVAFHAHHANGDSIGIEHEATPGWTRNGHVMPRKMPTETQYCASAAMVNALCQRYSIPMDRAHILGHSEADPGTAHSACPNSVWDWDYFMAMVTSATCFPRDQMPAPSSPAVGQALGDSGRARGRSAAADAPGTDDGPGIEGPIPDAGDAGSVGQSLGITAPEYPQAARLEPADPANYDVSSSPRAVNRVVIHITDGGPNINGTISWFKNPAARVSAHYVVGQNGEVVQMVANNDVAWHAHHANGDSIGVEHVASKSRGILPTEAEYCASAALVNWLCQQYGLPMDRVHIVGHSEADPHTRHAGCPNSVWDWDYFMAMVTSGTCFSRDQMPAPPAAAAQTLDAGQSFDINWNDVPLIAQTTNTNCWAAAGAMVASWAQNGPVPLLPGTPSDFDDFIRRSGLEPEPLVSTPVSRLRQLLETKGPLWVCADQPFGANPAFHAVVITGMYSDGAADGSSTFLRINDPWDRTGGVDPPPHPGTHDHGSQYVLSFPQFIREFEAAVRNDKNAWTRVRLAHAHDAGGRTIATGAGAAATGQALGGPGRRNGSHRGARHSGAAATFTRAQALPAVVIPIASAIVGATMTRIENNQGDITWELDQVQGLQHVDDNAANRGTAPFQTTVTTVDGPHCATVFGVDEIYADFEMTWEWNGRSLGNLRIADIHANDAVGAGLHVSATVRREANAFRKPGVPDTFAAIHVQFHYRFTATMQDDTIAITDLTLYGDGSVDKRFRWTQ